MEPTEGLVVRAGSGLYEVTRDGHTVLCALRGNLKKSFQYSTSTSNARRVTRAARKFTTDAVSIGDRVLYSEPEPGSGIIEQILPRTSCFARAGFRGREQTLVSNLDMLFVVFARMHPLPDFWKIDRFLVAAELADIPTVIIANKSDLDAPPEVDTGFAVYTDLGYKVHNCSAKSREGIEELRALCGGQITAFVGPSGVGKSSLLNALQPGLNLATAEIGYITFKGRHTTTSSRLLALGPTSWVADTPGLRDLEVLHLDRDDLPYCFPEICPHLGNCRFDNCVHLCEPGCAVLKAVESGEINSRRYSSFVAMSNELASKSRAEG